MKEAMAEARRALGQARFCIQTMLETENVDVKMTVGLINAAISKLDAALSAQPEPAAINKELVWLHSHCRAIGMTRKSESGSMEHDIALFTVDLKEAAQAAQPVAPGHLLRTMREAAQQSQIERGGTFRWEDVALAVQALYTAAPQEPADALDARFLLVSMDDDGCGTPVFCADEKAVRAALAPLLFFFDDKHPLNADDEASVDAHLENLLENGFLRFEGDPGINLYKLRAAAPKR
jgi:hypothetical protein